MTDLFEKSIVDGGVRFVKERLTCLPSPFPVKREICLPGLSQEDVYFYLLGVISSGVKMAWGVNDWKTALDQVCSARVFCCLVMSV